MKFSRIRVSCLALLSLALLAAGCAGHGLKESDPQLTGSRDMNYDHMIIPGQRIGPVQMGSRVSDAVKHLGNPDSVWRSTYRGPGFSADEVYYGYADECITFTWEDTGLSPVIERGLRGINVTCDKWATPDGLHVGSSMEDVAAHIGKYCFMQRDDGWLLIETIQGIWFWTKGRNSPVSQISVIPTQDTWAGSGCKD